MTKLVYTTRTRSSHSVVTEVKEQTDPNLVVHLQVHDLLAFAKKLEEAKAPLHQKVVMVESGRETGLMRVLRVDWEETLVDGQPAGEAL